MISNYNMTYFCCRFLNLQQNNFYLGRWSLEYNVCYLLGQLFQGGLYLFKMNRFRQEKVPQLFSVKLGYIARSFDV